MPNNSHQINAESSRLLTSHREYLKDEEQIEVKDVEVADVIHFLYDGETRVVFVLNPNYNGKLHGLSLKQIDRKTLMHEIVSKLNLYNNPHEFYVRVISKENIQRTDSYRTYDIEKMYKVSKYKYEIDSSILDRLENSIGIEEKAEIFGFIKRSRS